MCQYSELEGLKCWKKKDIFIVCAHRENKRESTCEVCYKIDLGYRDSDHNYIGLYEGKKAAKGETENLFPMFCANSLSPDISFSVPGDRMRESIIANFKETNEKMKNLTKAKKEIFKNFHNSTAATVLVNCWGTVYVSNLGNCAVYLSSKRIRSQKISKSHDLDNIDEVARLENEVKSCEYKILLKDEATRSFGSYDINEVDGKKMKIIIDEPEFADELSKRDLNMLLLVSNGIQKIINNKLKDGRSPLELLLDFLENEERGGCSEEKLINACQKLMDFFQEKSSENILFIAIAFLNGRKWSSWYNEIIPLEQINPNFEPEKDESDYLSQLTLRV